MAVPVIAAEAVTTPVSGDPVSVSVPAHNSGDRIVLCVTWDTSPLIQSISALNGVAWNQRLLHNAQQGVVQNVWYELWATSDQATATTVSIDIGSARPTLARCWRITGSHATQAMEVAGEAGGPNSTKDPPSLTPSWGADDNLWIAYGSHDGDASVSQFNGDPASYTILGTDTFTSASEGAEHRLAWRQLNAASEDPGTYSITNGIRGLSATRHSAGASARSQARPCRQRALTASRSSRARRSPPSLT